MTKRRRLVLASFILTLGLLTTQYVNPAVRYGVIFGLGVIAYFLTAFFIREDLKKISWLMNLPLPALYPVAVGLFYFLLPQGIASRIVILILFSIGMYAILLIENIFTISAQRTIQLLRAAQAVGFLMSLITSFLFFDTIFSYRLSAHFNALLVLLISLLIIIPSLWSVVLTDVIEPRIFQFGIILSILLGELAFVLSFWPLTIAAVSLFLTTASYVGLGIVQNHLTGRLFHNTLWEYLQVGIAILIITFFLGRWG